MSEKAYLAVEGKQYSMKDGPRSTVFGVLGMAKKEQPMRILGGLVQDTKPHMAPSKVTVMSEKKAMSEGLQTDRHILGPKPKTHIDGHHYAQVPFAGPYMGPRGKEL